jgi:peptide subunit release factor 1 (eRF1)
MISKTDLALVNEYKAQTGRVLSIYLDVDQSNAANLNRKFEVAFESKIKEAARMFEEEYERRDFDGCVAEVRKVLAAYEPKARGLVIFARSTGSIWLRELNVPVATEIFWGSTAHVQQFLEALDEFETYGVVVSDRSHSRIFTVKLGTIEKHAEIHAMEGVRHIKTAGADHLYSQSHLQRKADEHALSHLKRVGELLAHVSRFTPFERLVLAGATEATSELFGLLPKSTRAKVVAYATLPGSAPEDQILEEVLFIGRKTERKQERDKAEMLITASTKAHNAVTTLQETLSALNAKRVRELIYAEGFAVRGGVCDTCHAMFPNDTMNCGFCGVPVKSADDLIEHALSAALAAGATIEQLRGEGAEILKAAGGIGAFLRY